MLVTLPVLMVLVVMRVNENNIFCMKLSLYLYLYALSLSLHPPTPLLLFCCMRVCLCHWETLYQCHLSLSVCCSAFTVTWSQRTSSSPRLELSSSVTLALPEFWVGYPEAACLCAFSANVSLMTNSRNSQDQFCFLASSLSVQCECCAEESQSASYSVSVSVYPPCLWFQCIVTIQ